MTTDELLQKIEMSAQLIAILKETYSTCDRLRERLATRMSEAQRQDVEQRMQSMRERIDRMSSEHQSLVQLTAGSLLGSVGVRPLESV